MTSALMQPQVVITGVGLVTPLGASMPAFSQGLQQGRSALSRMLDVDKLIPGHLATVGSKLASPFGARISDFTGDSIDPARRRRMPRLAQLCIVAAQNALGVTKSTPPAAALHGGAYGAERTGVVLGTGLGCIDVTLEFEAGYIQSGPPAASPALFPYTVMNTASALVAMELQLTGPNVTINHRDLSFHEALSTAIDLLLCDRADAVICGGGDELSAGALHGHAQFGALASADPAATEPPMHPYDRSRHGLLLGEGAVMFVVERAERAAARGAKVLARVSGLGRGGDDRPRLGWTREGQPPAIAGAVTAVQNSLRQAGLSAAELSFISGNGNGTTLESLETLVLREALGAAADTVAIASILGQTGDYMTSAGVRCLAALCALTEQFVPGTTLCHSPDPTASLPGLNLKPRPAHVEHVLIPSLAQGGGSAALILSRP